MLWVLNNFILFKRRLRLCQCILLLMVQTPCFGWSLFSDPGQAYQHIMSSGDRFHSSVPEGVKRINQTLLFSLHPRDFSELRLNYPPKNMKSTGLYYVKGEPITVRTQPADGNELTPKLFLSIGIHTDRLSHVPAAERRRPDYGRVSIPLNMTHPLSRTSPISGLVYLSSSDTGTGSFEVALTGAVKAPWFKLGRDSLEQWQNEIRHYPAPWAELEGEYTRLALPSTMIRELDDPVAVVLAYDQVVKDANALVGLSPDTQVREDKAPDLPFQFVLDIHTSMDDGTRSHNGYPIVLYWLHYGNPFRLIDPDTIRSGNLIRHEIGHNYEPEERAFEPPGAAQAFAEIFPYGYRYQSGYWFIFNFWDSDFLYYYFPFFEFYWDIFLYIFGYGYNWDIWGEEVDEMLPAKTAFMAILINELSPKPLTKLYQDFRRLPGEQIPSQPQEKTDYFFESLCRITGQDLTLLFRSWRVPVSSAAYQRVLQEKYEHPRWLYHDGL